MVHKDRCVLARKIHCAFHNDEWTKNACQENIPQTIMIPLPARDVPAMVAGYLLSEVSRRIYQRPPVLWNIKRDSLENATYRPSVDVQLQYWRTNSSLCCR
ncbi:hypothetical protein TNCV_2297141 [Trichonephila clavipes]|nr:hypothetical protein TNCV_2297141 [Trichonephila clavipes]